MYDLLQTSSLLYSATFYLNLWNLCAFLRSLELSENAWKCGRIAIKTSPQNKQLRKSLRVLFLVNCKYFMKERGLQPHDSRKREAESGGNWITCLLFE